jgi:hypothetical protein
VGRVQPVQRPRKILDAGAGTPTGLLVCTKASGRSTRPCWDPWPAFYDFQALISRSNRRPNRCRCATLTTFGAPVLQSAQLTLLPMRRPQLQTTRRGWRSCLRRYYANLGQSAAFIGPEARLSDTVFNLQTIVPQDYDGTFIPSSSVRTVTPPSEATELDVITKTDKDMPDDQIWSPPWSVIKQV